MAYFLKHYFDPEFDHTHLAPKERDDGSVDHQDLGYVQNVVATQVLAEWIEIPSGDVGEYDRKYLANEPREVCGEACKLNPENPSQIIAEQNGYVFYRAGLIVVRSLLNVRRDVDYHTGNIAFVGDVEVHGSVLSDFRIRARNIRVKDTVGGSRLNAMDSINCEGGVKGAGSALIRAGKTIKASFCENATLVAKDNVVVDGACMHSTIFAGHKYASKGRFTGGAIYCYEFAFIGGQLGGGMGAETSVMAGYDPVLLFADQLLNEQLYGVKEEINELRLGFGKAADLDEELTGKISVLEKRRSLLYARKSRVWDKISASKVLESCRIMVKGKITPGVEISIGPAWYRVDDFMEDVYFYLEDMEIKVGSPALKK